MQRTIAFAFLFALAPFASCTCTTPSHDVAEGEGSSNEGEGGEGEGTASGEGEGSSSSGEGEGSAVGEGEGASSSGEGEGTAAGEGEGAAGEGEGEGEGEGVSDGSTIVIQIFAHDDCTVDTIPASITVSAGTGFYATFENEPSSAEPVDVDKIDEFNAVPLVLGLDVGTSYPDTVVEWCGAQFTGTFEFRISPCGDVDPHFLDVNCGG